MMSHVMRDSHKRKGFYRLQEAYVLMQMSPAAIKKCCKVTQLNVHTFNENFLGAALAIPSHHSTFFLNNPEYFLCSVWSKSHS